MEAIMAETLQEFEQKLKQLIDNPEPKPKYELWRTIRWKIRSKESNYEEQQGRIVGFYFMAVGVAFQDASEPGWYYYLQDGYCHAIIHEDDIVGGIE
jgi:hypothetical protein